MGFAKALGARTASSLPTQREDAVPSSRACFPAMLRKPVSLVPAGFPRTRTVAAGSGAVWGDRVRALDAAWLSGGRGRVSARCRAVTAWGNAASAGFALDEQEARVAENLYRRMHQDPRAIAAFCWSPEQAQASFPRPATGFFGPARDGRPLARERRPCGARSSKPRGPPFVSPRQPLP